MGKSWVSGLDVRFMYSTIASIEFLNLKEFLLWLVQYKKIEAAIVLATGISIQMTLWRHIMALPRTEISAVFNRNKQKVSLEKFEKDRWF